MNYSPISVLLFLSLMLLSCSKESNKDIFTPVKAILLAAESAPNGVEGVFELKVKGTGVVNEMVYLNSQIDYRDQLNISVAIAPAVAEELKNLYGSEPEIYFKEKSIIVTGTAKRTKILFICEGQPTDKYYYQTHIKVTSTDQIEFN